MLTLQNVSFGYFKEPVLTGIDLQIKSGEFIGIIGPNGAGKSTLIKLMNGMLSPESGVIKLDDHEIGRLKKNIIARTMAYVPQEINFSFDYLVRDVVLMGRFPYLKYFGIYGEEDYQIARESMEVMEITQFENRKFSDLSGGEKQRVVVASALAQNPKIMLLDEPTSALDLHHQISIYTILKQQQKTTGLTSVIVTHDINLAAQFCDRMIILHQGKIIRDGKPGEILQFQLLQEIFGVKVYIDINPMTDSIYILPYG